jgi:hypothetical protein
MKKNEIHFTHKRLTRKQKADRLRMYDEICEVMGKYPLEVPMLVFRGLTVNPNGATIVLEKELDNFVIEGCTFVGTGI